MPAPSPSTKPSRSLSNGRLAVRRIVVALRQRAQRREPADAHVAHRRFGAAGDHRVGRAALDDLERIADRVRRRGARGAGREVRPLGAEADRHLPRREIDDRRGDEERRDLARPAFEVGAVLLFDGGEPADAGADEHADARRQRRVDRQLRIVHRILRGRDGELNEDVHLLQFLLFDELQRVEVLHFAREPCRKGRRVEARDRADAARARAQRIPVRLSAHADRRDQTHAGHYDSPVQLTSEDVVTVVSGLAGPHGRC